jgi:hypothetical protein
MSKLVQPYRPCRRNLSLSVYWSARPRQALLLMPTTTDPASQHRAKLRRAFVWRLLAGIGSWLRTGPSSVR